MNVFNESIYFPRYCVNYTITWLTPNSSSLILGEIAKQQGKITKFDVNIILPKFLIENLRDLK